MVDNIIALLELGGFKTALKEIFSHGYYIRPRHQAYMASTSHYTSNIEKKHLTTQS